MICLSIHIQREIFFYDIAWHFLVRGEEERRRGNFEKKMTKFGMAEGRRGFQKMLFCERHTFWMASMWKFWKKNCIFDPQTVIYNKLLFFLQMENWLLVNRSFNDDNGKPVRAIAVRSSVLRTFTEDCNSSVSSTLKIIQ